MSAMKQALEQAGVRSPSDRLKEIVVKAMVRHAHNKIAAQEAIWDDVKNSASLLTVLFSFWRRDALERAITDTHFDLFAQQIPGGGRVLKPLSPREEKAHSASRKWRKQEHDEMISRQRERERLEHEERIKRYQRSSLATFRIDAVSIGDMTAAAARAWAAQQARHVMWVDRITTGIPVHSVDPIKKFVTPDEADEAWKQTHAGQMPGEIAGGLNA